MQYQISGKQIDIGEALQTHVKDELGSIVQKYAERPTDANVVFSRMGAEFVCEAVVHLSTGLTAQARGHAHDIYAAFDNAGQKMETQLRRYKRRLKNHHQERAEPVEHFGASYNILAGSEDTHEQPYSPLREGLRKTIAQMRSEGTVRPERFIEKPIDPEFVIENIRELIGS